MEQRPLPQTFESPQLKQEIAVGTLVGGRYRVQQLLGQGGFGRSYLATDTQRFDEHCVLKEFVPTNQSSRVLQKALDLFKKEAKTLYQIDHPQIPKFLAGFTQSQRLFIVQEYINGITYAQLLRQRQQQRQLFSEIEVIQWLRYLLPVLDYLHSLNLIHRDISPDNIMFSRDRGLPVLIDFGLVKDSIARTVDSVATGCVNRASMVGKFGYSPPEQIRMGHCYPCSDLYALGVTGIVLLTGKHPNTLIDAESMQWQWQSHVILRTGLKQVLEKLVMPQPKERFQSAQEVLDAMQNLPALPPGSVPVPIVKRTLPISTPHQFEYPSNKQPTGSNDVTVLAPAVERSLTTSAFLERCRQELTRCVGPIASVLVDEILAQYPYITAQGFIETLTSQISNIEQAKEFKSRLKIPVELIADGQLLATPASAAETVLPQSLQTGDHTSNQGNTKTSKLDDAFMDSCVRELTRCVGPIANVIIKKVLTHNPQISRRTLIEALAVQIPDPQRAIEFRQQLKRFE